MQYKVVQSHDGEWRVETLDNEGKFYVTTFSGLKAEEYARARAKEYEAMNEHLQSHYHDWETSSWGVVVGVSKCKVCGKRSTKQDFEVRDANSNQ